MEINLALGSFATFLLLQTGVLVWNLSKMNTTLAFIRADLDKGLERFEKTEEKRSAEFSKMWNKIDDHGERLSKIETKCKLTLHKLEKDGTKSA